MIGDEEIEIKRKEEGNEKYGGNAVKERERERITCDQPLLPPRNLSSTP